MTGGFVYFFLIICSLCQLICTAKVRDGCEPLLQSTWAHVCNGIITKEIKIKYKDQLTTVGTPYKIMCLAKQKHAFLITFFKSDMQNCSSIDINENMTLTCANTKLIKTKPQLFYCFNFGLDYLADLMDLCFDQADSLSVLTSRGIFTALHYSHMPPLVSAQVRLSAVDFVAGSVLTAVLLSVLRMYRNCL